MKGINKVTLVGIAGKNAESQATADGVMVTKFSLVTSQKFKDKKSGETRESNQWHNIVAFGKIAEFMGNFVTKGSKVYIEGSIDYQTYEKNGDKKTFTKIIARDFVMLSDNRRETPDNVGNVASSDDWASTNDIPF